MADRVSRKDLVKQEDQFMETAFDIGEWLEKHWKSVAVSLGAILVLVAAFGIWQAWSSSRLSEARDLLARGIAAYAPSEEHTGAASNPSAALPLFEKAAAIAGSRPIGQAAVVYRARVLLDLSRPADAAAALEPIVATPTDPALGAGAKALLARAYEKAGQQDKAATILQDLASAKDAIFPADEALLRLGKLRAAQGRAEDGKKAWQEILTRYPQGAAAAEARTLLSGGTGQ